MKLKKYSYLLTFVLMLIIGINGVYAKKTETCYYQSDGNESKVILEVRTNLSWWENIWEDYTQAKLEKTGYKLGKKKYQISNWNKNLYDEITGMNIDAIYSDSQTSNNEGKCQRYIVVRTNDKYKKPKIFAVKSKEMAENIVNKSRAAGYEAWRLTYLNEDNTKITKEQYYSGFAVSDTIYPDELMNCDPKKPESCEIVCNELFGTNVDKNSPEYENTIAYLVDLILGYVRIIVPILIIFLGTIDLCRAAFAGREDEMKKAQKTFVTRVILGMVVFFVPVIVDIVMWGADIAWEGMGYTTCTFK